MPETNSELASWLKGSSAGASPAPPPAASSADVHPELSNWLGGGAATSTAAPSAGPSTPAGAGFSLLELLDRPRNAFFVGARHTENDTSPLFDKGFWGGFWRGLTGEEHYRTADNIKEGNPGWAQAHPVATQVLGFAGDLAGDPLMYGGEAVAKAVSPAFRAAGALALGAPEGVQAAEAVSPLLKLAATSKPAIAAGNVLRSVAGQFSIDAALSHLPQGANVTQAIREFLGRRMAGNVEIDRKLADLARGLADATPEEKATLAHILDAPTAAEAQAKAAREAAAAQEGARAEAALNYQAPAPFDATGIESQVSQVQAARSALPGPEYAAVQRLAAGSGQAPEAALDEIAKRVYGYADGQGAQLNPFQRGQVVRAFNGAQSLDEGYSNLADLIRTEGAHGPGPMGTALRNRSAMEGADPFARTPEQQVQSLQQELDRLTREHAWASSKYDYHMQPFTRQAAQEINAANSTARNAVWQKVLNIGKIRPGSGTAGAELTKALPSFLKDARGGMGLDEIASSLGMSEQELVDEITGVMGARPVTRTSPEAVRSAEARWLAMPEGQQMRDQLSAYRQQLQDVQEALGAAQQELAAKRGPFDDLAAGEFPRPAWAQQAEPSMSEEDYLALERAGITGEAGATADRANQARQVAGVTLDAIPEQYRHLVEPVMQKYGQLIPQFRALTDEAYARARGFLPDLGYQEFYYPRLSRTGQAEEANPIKRLLDRLVDEGQQVQGRPDALAPLSTKPGFSKERTLDTLADYADYAGSRGRHAVLDPVDALHTHMRQSVHAEQSAALRDRLLAIGDGTAVKAERFRDIPPGYMDMSDVPGWQNIAVQGDIGRVLREVLMPARRGAAGVLYDTVAQGVKNATFYNPLVHGKNLAFRAYGEGMNPLGGLARDVQAEVADFGPTLRRLVEHGGATEYRPGGAEAANALYREARLEAGTAAPAEKIKNVADWLHNSLWDYDKGLRVQMARKLESEGVPWPEIAQRVNQAYGKPLDPTFANMWLKRVAFTPAWTANNLAWNAANVMNPRVRAFAGALDAVNRANTGHGREENPHGKEEYTALTGPGPDGKSLFVNVNTPDKDLREAVRNPLDWLWQRGAPIPMTAGGMLLGNSRPFDPKRGLDYNAPGAGGPLFGYGSNGFGPDVGLRTQASARQLLPMLGYPLGSAASEAADTARSADPLRDFLLGLLGMYASDYNERLGQALDTKDRISEQRQEIRARAIRDYKRQNQR